MFAGIMSCLIMALAFAGCETPLAEEDSGIPPEDGMGILSVSLSMGEEGTVQTAKHVGPDSPSLDFEFGVIQLVPSNIDSPFGMVQHSFEGNTTVKIQAFPIPYRLYVYLYTSSNDTVPIATGVHNVVIVSGEETAVTVPLALTEINAGGTLKILPPADQALMDALTKAEVEVTKSGAVLATLDLLASKTEVDLPSGYYTLRAVFQTKDAESVWFETLSIIHGHSTWDLSSVSGRDFNGIPGIVNVTWTVDPDEPPMLSPTDPVIAYGSTIVFQVENEASYTDIAWILDGKNTGVRTPIYTLKTDGLAPGSHQISVLVMSTKGPMSSSTRFIVQLPVSVDEHWVRRVSNSSELAAAINDPAVTEVVITSFLAEPLPHVNRDLTVHSDGSQEIDLSGTGSLFTVEAGGQLTLHDITLKGVENNNAALITVTGGKLVLNENSRVTGNRHITVNQPGHGGGIYAVGNALVELKGGKVDHNVIESFSSEIDKAGGIGAGIFISASTLIIESGFIEHNEILASSSTTGVHTQGAGIGAEFGSTGGSTVFIRGGIIRANKASAAGQYWVQAYGGGISVSGASTLVMEGGIISGNTTTASVPNVITGPFWTEFPNEYHELGCTSGGAALVRWNGYPSLRKTGGIIYGVDAVGTDSEGYPLANQAANGGDPNAGHALYAGLLGSPDMKYVRNTTVGEDEVIMIN
jgi:hypothetical protein